MMTTPTIHRPARLRLLSATTLAVLLLGGCATGEPDESAEATPLSVALVEDDPSSCADVEGEPLAEPELRAVLAGLVQDHVDLTHDLVAVAGAHGLDSAEFAAADADLDANGLALGDAVAMVYDRPSGDAFVALWRSHLDFFKRYAVGVATGDEAAQAAADADLRRYSEDFAAFFFAATDGEMEVAATVADFDGHVDTVEAMIRDTLTGAESEDTSAHSAHDHVTRLSSAMSGAISRQFPCRFPQE